MKDKAAGQIERGCNFGLAVFASVQRTAGFKKLRTCGTIWGRGRDCDEIYLSMETIVRMNSFVNSSSTEKGGTSGVDDRIQISELCYVPSPELNLQMIER